MIWLIIFLTILIIFGSFQINFYPFRRQKQFPKQLFDSLIAHRGLFNTVSPENSLGAFKRALKKSMPIELDVVVTADDVPMVIHDNNLKRLTGFEKKITELNLAEIKKLKIKKRARIPTLEQVLSLVDGRVPLVIEIKPDSINKQNRQAIMQVLSNYQGDFVIQSFSPSFLFWLRLFHPKLIRGQLLSKTKHFHQFLFNFQLNLINLIVKPDYLACSKKLARRIRLTRARQKGLKIIGWTFKTKNLDLANKPKEFDNIIVELRS